MPYVYGLLKHDGVYCSYRVTARREEGGVVLSAIVRPVAREPGSRGGREAVVPCALDLAGQLSEYFGTTQARTVRHDYFSGNAKVRLHVPTRLSSRTLLEHIGEEFRMPHRIAFPASMLRRRRRNRALDPN
jgi:hypothetical protein